MKIRAHVQNSQGQHHVTLRTNDQPRSLSIPAKPDGRGSSVNGGELLLLALATCYCNDLYREAAKRGIEVTNVAVEVAGEFAAEGAVASNISYRAKVMARASEEQIRELMRHTDAVAEIQKSVRGGVPVELRQVEAVSV